MLAEVYWILTTKNTLGFSATILNLLEMLQVLVNKVHDLAQVVIYIPRDSGILYLKIRTFLQFSRVLMECYFLLNLFKNYPEFFQLEFYWLLIIKRYHPSSSSCNICNMFSTSEYGLTDSIWNLFEVLLVHLFSIILSR